MHFIMVALLLSSATERQNKAMLLKVCKECNCFSSTVLAGSGGRE